MYIHAVGLSDWSVASIRHCLCLWQVCGPMQEWFALFEEHGDGVDHVYSAHEIGMFVAADADACG